MQGHSTEKDRFFTGNRSFYSTLFPLLLGITVQNVIAYSVNMMDNIMLGSYSQTTLSGAAVVNQIFFITQQIALCVADALIMIGAQYAGKGEMSPVRKMTGICLRFGMICGMVILGVCTFLPRQILTLFTESEAIVEEGLRYLSIIRFTFVLFMITNILTASLRCVKIVRISMVISLVSLVVGLVVLTIFAIFSTRLTSRVSTLLGGIRTVRAGEYTHRVSVTGHDELAQLADEFNQLTGRLQATEEERRRFVSDASHELKTPLASIRLMTDTILQDEAIDRETTREFVADIGESADRLIHISQELLALNRLDEARTSPRERVDVNARAEQTCRMLAPLAREAGVTVETDLGADCVACCDPEDVSQIFRNLMENAIKYNVPGGTVTVSTRRAEDHVLLEVADTGMGIPAEDRERIFQRFYRVDKARSRAAGGTGLGLSIVQDTVRLHGGTIDVRPREGGGTVFSVSLPAWREEGTP